MKDYSSLLNEKFGTPIGEVPGITSVGAVGVRDEETCPDCEMPVVEGMCGCDESNEGYDDEEGVLSVGEDDSDCCDDCGMMVVDGSCGCGEECPHCNQMPAAGSCGCSDTSGSNWYAMTSEEASEEYLKEADKVCNECGMNESMCECGMNESKKRKGPSKKAAQKILKGTKTFAQKMQKVSGWAKEPAAAASWMMHKATGKWPSEK